MRKTLVCLAALGMLTSGLIIASSPARATDWCTPMTATISRTSGYTTQNVGIVFTLHNGIDIAVQVYHIYATFPGESAEWDWGGMSLSGYGSGSTPNYGQALPSPGNYPITARVNGQAAGDWFSADCSFYWTFTVRSLPQLSITLSANPSTGRAPLNAGLVYDVVGAVDYWTIDFTFGDGASDTYGPVYSIGGGGTESHTYASPGTYTATARVSDGMLRAASASAVVTVTSPPPPPTVSLSANPGSGKASLQVSFTASASGGEAPLSYYWEFGDGEASSGGATISHTYTRAGQFTASVRVTDGEGRVSSDTVLITVTDPTLPSGCGQGTDNSACDSSQSAAPTIAVGAILVVAAIVVGWLISRRARSGKRGVAVAPPPPASPQTTSRISKVCPTCGLALAETSQFCPKDGTKL